MPFRSEKQRRYLWANEPKIAREWTDEYGSKPVKAKAGKYQEFKHPEHDVKPLEHMEDKVSSKERIERLLQERKSKKEKKKLVKEGPHYVPGWKPNLSVKAAEGELIRQKTRGTGAAVKGVEHYTMKGMPTAYQGQLIQAPTRGTGAAVKGTDHYIMPGMDAAKEGKMIKAKKGLWAGAATSMGDKPPGWDVKKISDKTHKKLTKLWKHREAGVWSPAAGKRYKEHLKGLKKATTKPSKFLQRRMTLGSARDLGIGRTRDLGIGRTLGKGSMQRPPKFSRALSSQLLKRNMTLGRTAKLILKKTALGKGIAAATVVAGAYEAGKRKLFTKKDKKKVDKKSIGGETVVMKSGGGYIDNLL